MYFSLTNEIHVQIFSHNFTNSTKNRETKNRQDCTKKILLWECIIKTVLRILNCWLKKDRPKCRFHNTVEQAFKNVMQLSFHFFWSFIFRNRNDNSTVVRMLVSDVRCDVIFLHSEMWPWQRAISAVNAAVIWGLVLLS